MLFFLTVYLSSNSGKSITGSKKKAAQLFLTLIINQNVRMISEGSCDTEDWSNDAENSAVSSEEEIIFKVY